MRVLHISHQYTPAIGGAERYIINLSEELVRRGHEVDLFTSRAVDYRTWQNELPARETINGVNVRRFAALPRRGHTWRALEFGMRHYWPKRNPAYAPFIFYGNGPVSPGLFWAVLTQAHRYDLIHINQLHYAHAATAFAAAQLRGVPIITTPHLHAEQRETYDVAYMQKILRQSHLILADTEAERDFMLQQGYPPLQVATCGVGLDLSRFPPQESAAARARLGLPTDAFVVLFLGRKTAYKGLEPSLAAFRALQRSHPHAYFVAMGPETPESRKLWQEVSQELGQEIDQVPNLLVRDAVSDDERLAALAAADVFLMPSSGEAFGIVYLEAWTYGKPVIGAPIQAVSALISDGVDGWLIEPTEVEAITARLAWLADHPEAAQAAGAAGHAKLLRRHTIERIGEVAEAAYIRARRRHKSQRHPPRV
ncbi:MAG: glycosyltransferase family 4 protein [Caldilineaceae bacterium]|nr:glycosyltransferase family 4 protein [Caldilineaceae bacterium]